MNFKVGDVVVIDNFSSDVAHHPGVGRIMRDFLGATVTVSYVGEPYITIEEDGGEYVWAPEWFKPVGKQKKTRKSKAEYNRRIVALRKKARDTSYAATYCHYALLVETDRGYTERQNWNDVCHYRIACGGNSKVVALIDF